MSNETKKFAGLEALQTFLEGCKTLFASITHKHTLSDISDYTVDTELSSTSTNPIANSTVNEELEAVSTAMDILEQAIDDKLDASTASSTYETKTNAQTKLDEAKEYTDTKTANFITSSTVDNKISTHNTSTSAHNDIRDLINGLSTRLNALADSDDETLDQMSEIVEYIKANKALIDSVTTSKVSVSDIIDNLTTNVSNKPLSAAQGVAIKALIDALQAELDSHTHEITDVTGLQSALDGKSGTGHTHTVVNGVTPEWSGSIANADTNWLAAWSSDGTKIKALDKGQVKVGNAANADNAICACEDEDGNNIIETYATKTELDNSKADWLQFDTSASNYVKNRPCYKNIVETGDVIVNNAFLMYDDENSYEGEFYCYHTSDVDAVSGTPVEGNIYKISIGDEYYEEECYSDNELYCGGGSIYIDAPYAEIITGTYLGQSVTLTITEMYSISYIPLDTRYLPYYANDDNGEIFNDYYNNEATGSCSHAEGYNTHATGDNSHAEGSGTSATGDNSHAEGYFTHAMGDRSHAEGRETWATGISSHSEGYCTTATNLGAHSGGKFNKAMKAGGATGNTTGDVFVLGNGTSSSKLSNAFRVTYAGASYGLSAFNSSGADYAEFFEWEDGNTNAEDRVGYFVTLNGDKIIKANSSDEYILGIISGQPCIVGNSDEDWLGRWEHDEFGRFIKVETEDPVIEHKVVRKRVPKTDEEGNPVIDENGKSVMVIKHVMEEVETGEVIKGWTYKENSNYDNTKEYVERKDRIEWDYVGMLGVLSVRDNGECIVNGFCKCGEGGIAIPASKGYDSYRVIERVSDNVIKIVFR